MDGFFEFATFRADVRRRQLFREGEPVCLSAKAFEVLILLLRSAGEVVTRESLIDAVWSDTAVEDNNLTQQISALRKALGEQPGDHKFILTVPGRGYSFVAEVNVRLPESLEITTERPSLNPRRTIRKSVDRSARVGYAAAMLYILLVMSPFVVGYLQALATGDVSRTLAVLDFRSARGDEFIGTGVSDTLRARLGSVEDLTLRPAAPGSADYDVIATGRRLQVDAVVTGSVQRSNERVRVTVEMVNVGDGRIVWGRTFDDDLGNLFALQDEIVSEVARAVAIGPRPPA